jgi:hypothetical protein
MPTKKRKATKCGMDKAFAALQKVPSANNRPEDCFTSAELSEKHYSGSRHRAANGIKDMLENGIIKSHEITGRGGLKYYYYVE